MIINQLTFDLCPPGRGRRGRDEEDDDDYSRKGPSAPATIFDFMVTKNPKVIPGMY